MAREVSHFVCQECGFESPKWAGQCPECSKWNTFVEAVAAPKKRSALGQRSGRAVSKPLKLSEVRSTSGEKGRVKTGISELDRVLGGGMVPGSVALMAGEPGIGKSTLLTQLAMRQAQGKTSVLYVCGEESPEQVKLRVERLEASRKRGRKNGKVDILLLSETDTDVVVATVSSTPSLGLIIVDSIQTMSTADLTGMAGSVGQIRESAFRLIEVSKRTGVPLYLVGHVTKQGSIAGPKILEHMVDVVLSLEGDRSHDFRILRGSKNRFGATDEVGVFAMGDSGMEEVKNPSDVFLEERVKQVPGSVVVATVAGLRPMLVEIQALVVPTQLSVPRRVSTGVDQRKVQLMAAVLQKHCKLGLGGSDIFVNVAGGLKINEPAIDLGLALAIASGFSNKAVPRNNVAIGEVGLLGEIRRVGKMKQRVKEAKKLGYTRVLSAEKYRTLAETVRKVLR